jgi:hypothetical protein
MLNVKKNRHRWKLSLDLPNLRMLEEFRETLAWAWKRDMEAPKTYPMNTWYAFFRIKKRIRESKSASRPYPEQQLLVMPPLPPPPTCLLELVSEGTICAAYEDQNAGSYSDALKRAARDDDTTFRKILNAIEQAYLIDRFGLDVAPQPRIHFLHRNLLEIVSLLGLGDLKHEGILELLDDLCPCGKMHRPDAIRKLRKRLETKSDSKS